jgi:hypothetical protein
VAPTLSARQLLGTGVNVTDFHILDGLLCHLGHLHVPTSEREKLIWEAHSSRMAGHFGVEKTMVVLQKHFFGQNCERTSTSISDLPLHVPFPSQPSRSKSCTLLCLLLRGLENPSQWVTCLALHPPSKAMIVYSWCLISF